MREWLRRLGVIFTQRRFERDLDDELRFHHEMKRDALEADGLTPTDARDAATRAIGGGAGGLRVRERSRDVWIAPALDAMTQDVRHALRLLRRNPGFTITALLTLALGIGLNTAIFSIVYGVLLKPLEYRDPSRLVVTVGLRQNEALNPNRISWTQQEYHALADANQTLDGLTALTGTSANVSGQGEPQALWGLEVSPNFFHVFGIEPQLGRAFAFDKPHADTSSVLISDRLWRRAFNADPGVIGRAINIDGNTKTIIGVLPPGFAFRMAWLTTEKDIILANDWDDPKQHNSFLVLIGRLRADVTPAQAEADLTAIRHRFELENPDKNRTTGRIAKVIDLRTMMVGTSARLLLQILTGAVLLVLLIVAVNIANLQLARWSSRRTELSLRMALGAGRRRIARQLLTESLVLAIAGGALGTIIAYLAVPLLIAQLPEGQLPRIDEIRVSAPVLIFSALLSMATGMIFGLLPAMRQSTLSRADDLRGSAGRTATTGRQTERLRSALVIGQVALTLVLLVSAGLLMHSFLRVIGVQPGFSKDDVLTMTVTLPERQYPTEVETKSFTGRVIERLQQMPGASASSAITMVPFGIFAIHGDFEVEGQPKPKFYIGKPKIAPGYFKTLGIPLLQGRDFEDSDTASAPKVAIISERVAKQLWPDGSAIGKRLRLDGTDWFTIVGIAGDVRQYDLQQPTEETIYLPYQQETKMFFLRTVTFVARTTRPQAAADYMRGVIRQTAPDLPITTVKTMDALLSESVAQPRMRMLLIGSFALCALMIATLGIYGVMTYAVTQRRREIGIRMAIGAEWTDVVWLVLRRALVIVAVGAVIGIAASLAVTKTLTSFLFEVTPNDPSAIAGVTVLLVLIALIAAWLPARRAAQTDPVEALRVE
jgi:predicted permease